MRPVAANYSITESWDEVVQLFHTAAKTLQTPANRLLEILRSAGCRSAVLEDEYVDMDFKAGYSRFYYLHHRDTNRRCRRVHFFGTIIRDADIYSMSDLVKRELLASAVVRPLPSHVVGRTILSRMVLDRMYSTLYAGESRFLTCAAFHQINIAGNSITMAGIPWMQQDKLIAVCASAAIWTANWHLCHLYPQDFIRYSTPQITDFAVRFSMSTGRAMPSGGLTVEQMTSALKAMRYEPFLRNPLSAFEARRTIYHYIESGIPVIAIIAFPTSVQQHAITIVGHTLNLAKPTVEPKDLSAHDQDTYVASNSDFVPRYIAQDDSSGPFRFLELLEWSVAKKKGLVTKEEVQLNAREFACVVHFDHTDKQKGGYSSESEYPVLKPNHAFLRALLVPVPLRVTLDGTVAELTAVQALKQFWPNFSIPSLMFRTFLQPSNDLKKWWGPRPSGQGRPPEVGFGLRTHSFPSWVWITEFAERNSLIAGGDHVLGQVIQDSSGRGASVDPGDDVVAIIGPDRVVFIPPNSTSPPLDTQQLLTEPIRQYRTKDV